MPQTETKTGAGLNTIRSVFENFREGVMISQSDYEILIQNLLRDCGLPSINNCCPLGMALRFLRTGKISLFYDLLRLEDGLVPQILAALPVRTDSQLSISPLENGSYYYYRYIHSFPISIKTGFGLLTDTPTVYSPSPPLDPTGTKYLYRPSKTSSILLLVSNLLILSFLSFIVFKYWDFFGNLMKKIYPIIKNISFFKHKIVEKIEEAPKMPKNGFQIVRVGAGVLLTYSVYLILSLIMEEEKVPAPVKTVLYPHWYTTSNVALCEAGEADPWWDPTCDTDDICRRLPTHCLPPSDWR